MNLFNKNKDFNPWENAPQIIVDTVNEIFETLNDANINVISYASKSIYNRASGFKYKCSGYFSDPDSGNSEIGFAYENGWEHAFRVLVHEYCHFLQWKEQATVWTDLIINDERPLYWIKNWLMGNDISSEIIKKAFKAVRAIEMDCEKRFLQFVIERKLPVNIEKYAQLANINVMLYHYVEKYRTHNNSHKYNLPNFKPIYSVAPTSLGNQEIMPKALELAFDKYFGARFPIFHKIEENFKSFLNFNEFINLYVEKHIN